MNPKATPKPQFLISLSFLVITLFLSIPFPTLADEEYRFDRMWPTLQQPWYFKSPLGIAIDRNGYVYVAEIGQYRIQKFTADGILVHRWGKQGSGESEFNRPRAIAVDVNNVVYVVDSGNNRIQKFTSDGQFVSLWGSYGNGEGEFVSPGGIAIAPTGYIYIADTYNNRIQKFTPDGQLVTKWGNEGSGDGEFFWPEGIAVDKNGYVYVVDTLNYRIQKFTADGHFVGKWGSQGSGDGKFEFSYPSGIAVDDNEYVYVFDSGNQRIQKFTFDGQFVATWGTLGGGEGEFGYYGGAIAADNNGLLYVTDTGNYRIEKFTTESQFVAKWGSEGVKDGEFRSPLGITVDRSGTIYVADANNHRIQKFTSNGLFLDSWGSPGSGDGEFFVPWSIGVDKNGYLYVTDHHNNRVQKFTSDGQFVTKWGSEGWGHEGNAEGEFYWPEGIAVDGNGYVYVMDTYNHRIQKFTSDGQFVATWGREGSNDSEFYYPSGIAVDENGYVFVADTSNNRIQKFTSEGEFLNKWGVFGGGDGEFDGPSDLRIDQDGFLYVTDSYNHRIQKFTTDGQFVTKWGSLGSEPGNFNVPSALAIDSSGRFFVSESGNNRIQAFKKVTQTSNNKAIIVAGGGPYPGNNLWEATQMCANFAYRTLTFQGFTKESIYYLTSNTGLDLDSNGVSDDVDGDATTSNLQQAVTTWASGADDVVLYLTDHGGNGTFRMSDTETLSASQLDSWLDSIRQTISGKVIVIYDACESGSFLSSLRPPSGKERIIISSTSRGENAYFVTQGSISFSNYFWTHIFNGLTVSNAFTLAEEAISQTTNYQNPLLDDNGNGIGNEASDGALAQSTYLGNGTIIYGEAPVIGTVSPPQTLSNSSTTLLFADGVIDADGIARVWAVIRPPNYMQSSPDNPVQEIPSLNLLSVGGERYEGAYEHFNIPGTYQIAIYARDRIGNTSVPQLTTVSVNNPLTRKAIIVAGGQATDPLWPAIENNATLAYDALTYQGYTDETIYFMSPVTISSGVDTLPMVSNLHFAINTWAKQNTQDLVIFLIGNGNEGTFTLSQTETLSATSLDAWLDELQNTIAGNVTLIYDGCRSGSFLPLLTPPPGKKRILLASTGNDKPAYFLSDGDISFSKYFWNQVLNGATVRDAFIQANQAISFSFQEQTPHLDDNGNGVPNERTDGELAKNYTIGVGIMLAGDNPLIGSVSPNQTLSGQTSATVWAEDVTTTGTIEKVWAVIIPPNYSPGQPTQPVIALPIVALSHTGSGKYEGTYSDFSLPGTYQIIIYAIDANGNTSFPKETSVLVPPIPSFNVNGLTAHLTRLALSGQDVEISFTTDSQGTPLYYQYWLASGYQTQHYGNWQMLKDWSPDNTLMWAPESDDHYVVVAYVTDDPSSNSFHQAGLCIETAENSANPIQITGLTSNIRYPQNRGVPITLNTTAIGGGSPLFYKYLYCKGIGGIWQIISDYSTESSCTWTPSEAGLYTAVVWVTDNPSGNEYSIAGMTCTIEQ